MKAEIHPAYHPITVKCSCGYEFVTGSSLAEDSLNIEVCSNCHPFFTGKQKVIDTAGMVESFNRKFSKLGQKKPVTGQTKEPKLGTVKKDKE
jgi:large subunit ribosomal protein L31